MAPRNLSARSERIASYGEYHRPANISNGLPGGNRSRLGSFAVPRAAILDEFSPAE
jgi:hypothetical protein